VANKSINQLSRRERQIMDILFRAGEGSVASVRRQMTDPPSYSAVRALLGVLEDKGYLKHKKSGKAYIYYPIGNRKKTARKMLKHVVDTFYEGSVGHAAVELIGRSGTDLSDEEIARLEELIKDKKQKEGGK